METRTANRREQILEVAAHHFARRGFAGTSMRSLAHDVGITAAVIYRHYPSKLALFQSVIEAGTHGNEIRDHLETLRQHRDIEDVLRNVSLHLLTNARQHPELLRLLLVTSVSDDDDAALKLLQEFRGPYVDFLQSELTRRIDAGEIRAIDPGITARCYVGMVIACAINSNLWNQMEGVRQQNTLAIVDNNVPIFARGLRKRPGDDEDFH